jgi:hypothetical protein
MLSIRELTTMLFTIGIAVALSAALLYRVKSTIPPPVAVVDIVTLTTEETEKIIKGPGTTEEKGNLATAFTNKLNKEIEQLGKDCGCVLFVSAALVTQPERDLTEQLRRSLKK